MHVHYDSEKQRLIYNGVLSNKDFWEQHWSKQHLLAALNHTDRFVRSITRKYLRSDAVILEAGCGIADKVSTLMKAGFTTCGIDTAITTLANSRRVRSDLWLLGADVMRMPFKAGAFDACWSLGVLEHFPHGCAEVLDEMGRVLVKGGMLFITLPTISPLRQLKCIMGKYQKWLPEQKVDKTLFYQYAFSRQEVLSWFDPRQFQIVAVKSWGGCKGLKDECSLLRPILQRIYTASSNSFFAAVAVAVIELLTVSFAAHMSLFVVRKL